jgi:hypothetical protein
MQHLVGKVITKKVPFMGDEVEVRKMSVKEVLEIQKLVDTAAKSKSDTAQLGLLRDVIRLAVVGADEVTDENFNDFPIGELNDLTNAILAFSGLGEPDTGN